MDQERLQADNILPESENREDIYRMGSFYKVIANLKNNGHNKQAGITNQIIEISAGAEALS